MRPTQHSRALSQCLFGLAHSRLAVSTYPGERPLHKDSSCPRAVSFLCHCHPSRDPVLRQVELAHERGLSSSKTFRFSTSVALGLFTSHVNYKEYLNFLSLISKFERKSFILFPIYIIEIIVYISLSVL